MKDITTMAFQLNNRRYTGSKFKLAEWIVDNIKKNISDHYTFCELFAGTACISSRFINSKKLIINDFLYSNKVIYEAFFNSKKFNLKKLEKINEEFNDINEKIIKNNYIEKNFGNKYFSINDARKIDYIREKLEIIDLTSIEKNILLASLIYSTDRCANTVGHYDAYRKITIEKDKFEFKLIQPLDVSAEIEIYRMDANALVKQIKTDITYIDPPYNSRQYSRFYHVLENLVKWEKPELYGEALKPEPENISAYCKKDAQSRLSELIERLESRLIVVSYNNTYNSKSGSSRNKITYEEIEEIMNKKGKTRILSKNHSYFNAGKTQFDNHKEYLFITKV